MKKITALILSLCLLTGITVYCHAEMFYGDIDKDGRVNSLDALIVLQYSVGMINITDKKPADVNHDGVINSVDALYILKVSIGKTDKETIEATTHDSGEDETEKTETEEKDAKIYLNKKYLVFGDSYTFNASAEDTNKKNRAAGTTSWTTKFIEVMQPSEFWNKSVGGSAYGRSSTVNVTPGYVTVGNTVVDKTIKSPDVVLFFYGPNEMKKSYDYEIEPYFTVNGKERPLEEMTPIMISPSNNNDAISAMRWDIQTVKNAYPNAKIFVCTMTQFKSYDDSLFKRNKQIEVAERMGVEVIDVFNCGITVQESEKYIVSDNIHTNELGANLIADTIINSVKNYFETKI